MKYKLIALSILILNSYFSMNVMAQSTKSMTLKEVLRMATENNIGLQSARLTVEKSKILQGTAVNLDATSLSLSQDPTSGGSPDNAITISQNFALPSVYSAREKMLKAQTESEQRKLSVNENELRREVSLAFFDLLYAHDIIEIYTRQDSIYQDFNRMAVAKYNAGETGRLEQMNAKRLKIENEIKSQNARRYFQTTQLMLAKLLNVDTLIVPEDDNTFDDVYNDTTDLSDSPLLSLARAEEEVATRQLSLEKRGYLPTFSVGANLQMVIKGFNPYNIDRRAYSKGDFMGFSVGVNIPLSFGATKARVKAAKKDLEIAKLNLRSQENMIKRTYEAAYNNYITAKDLLNYYKNTGIPQAQEVERISRVSYENGSIGYVEFMQNMQTALDVWASYIDAQRNYKKAIVELNYLNGK
ncbi:MULTISPECIES: TolC family protein [Bacteroidales]|uniref:TolC family protein n=2 Tax=Prevotella heparinolytica TaxID=28113 RepID=UPI002A803734|nr:TolC family protein [Prevotella sp.]MDY4020101.1 TolC family protein [Prevotella sp.]